MKPIMTALFLIMICTCVRAQTTSNVVQERETEASYTYRVHLKEGSSHELMHCSNVVTDNNINVAMKGDLTTTIAPDATLRIVTRDRTL